MDERTRENWLLDAVEAIEPHLKGCGLTLQPVRVSCGWPSSGGINKVMGECWKSTCTEDGSRQIFISPLKDDPIEVLGILVHELLHASLGDNDKHGPMFKKGMKQLGLEGKPKYALPGAQLALVLANIAVVLGPYPNKHIMLVEKTRKNVKKTFELICCKDAEFKVKASIKTLVKGFPVCTHGNAMEILIDDQERFDELYEKEMGE